MNVEFTVEGRDVAEIRAAVTRRLDTLGDDIEWRTLHLDLRESDNKTTWLGDYVGTDEPSEGQATPLK